MANRAFTRDHDRDLKTVFNVLAIKHRFKFRITLKEFRTVITLKTLITVTSKECTFLEILYELTTNLLTD